MHWRSFVLHLPLLDVEDETNGGGWISFGKEEDTKGGGWISLGVEDVDSTGKLEEETSAGAVPFPFPASNPSISSILLQLIYSKE